MVVANIVVKNVKDYSLVSKLTEYSIDDTVTVDIFDRCILTVPYTNFAKCLGTLYRRNMTFEITNYYDTTDEED